MVTEEYVPEAISPPVQVSAAAPEGAAAAVPAGSISAPAAARDIAAPNRAFLFMMDSFLDATGVSDRRLGIHLHW
ncbi:hypothetical protein GCM10008112_01630 [Flexivirga endophytica]|nr:hypothetical protein GCM10008112_01630 [Flexivirga endophytica]